MPPRPSLPPRVILLVIASTWGEGDPPERAAGFYKGLMAEDAPRLEGVRFAVLALGDSSYVNFCEVGRRIDARLEELGGERIAARIDCDLDYEERAADWARGALDELARIAEPDAGGSRRAGRGDHPRRLCDARGRSRSTPRPTRSRPRSPSWST